MVTVSEFMSRNLTILDSETSVTEACKLMGEKHIGSVLISQKGVTHSIFTERDLFSRVLALGRDLRSTKVGTCASSPLMTVSPAADVKEAAHIMAEMKVRRLVVVQDGRPVGIFTSADLAKAVGRSPLEI